MVRRVVVRTAVAYLFLFWLPTPIDNLPWVGESVAGATVAVWRPLVELGGKVLSLEIPPPRMTGSGDTIGDYVRVVVSGVLALLIGLLWSLDKRRTRHEPVVDFSRDYLRLSLAMTLIGYGMAKVLVQQFPPLDQYTLFETYADSSPMGLLWRFMGFSPFYERFAGFAELVAGVLMIWRRTTTAGALVCTVVMSNVVLLNFCFDVPVKILSTHLLVFGLVLLAPDAKRLLSVIFTNRPTMPRDFSNLYARGRGRLVMPVASMIFAVAIIGSAMTAENQHELHHGPGALDGAYTVVRQTGGTTWHFVQFGEGSFAVKRGGEAWKYAAMKFEGEKISVGDETLTWAIREGAPVLSGTWEKEEIEVTLQKVEVEAQPIFTRGFHWVQPYPFNR
jgi:uncharacterized membrane protein YphA (DoxX/SURF4 family)